MSEIVRKAIKEIAGKQDIVMMSGTVEAVDENNRTCDVLPNDGSSLIYDVWLQGLTGLEDGMVVIPAKDSKAVVGMLDKHNAVLLSVSVVDKLIIKIDGQDIELDKSGLKWVVQQNSLKGLIDELISILTNFQLSTNMGLTIAVAPHIVTRLNTLKTNFGKLVK